MAASLATLSSEVLLRVLGYLDDARDLVRFRQVNHRLYGVGSDALLWRDLFVHTYLRSYRSNIPGRSRSGKQRRLSNDGDDADSNSTASASTSVREIKGLPMVQRLQLSHSNRKDDEDQTIDWYTLFKVSRNWQTGNFTSQRLNSLHNQRQDSEEVVSRPSKASRTSFSRPASQYTLPGTLIDSTRTHIFASFQPSPSRTETVPTVLVFSSKSGDMISSEGERSQETLARYQPSKLASRNFVHVRVSSLAVDRMVSQESSVRLFVGFSSGDSCLISYNTTSKTFHDELFLERTDSDAIVSAALFSTMLVTCTLDFKVRIYNTSQNSIKLIEERRTYSCHWPASLRLEPLDSRKDSPRYRLSIAYSSPVYPMGWTVGLQEIIVGTQSSLSSRSASARRAHVVTCIDSPSKEDKRRTLLGLPKGSDRRTQVGRLTSLSYEDPFIVVGTKDNNVVCFKVAGSAEKTSSLQRPFSALELSHVCTFEGHTGTVHSVSLNEGRCVTGGSDGSVRIWKLGDEEAAVAKAAGLLTTIDASLRRGLGKVVTIGSNLSTTKRKRDEKEAFQATPLSLADILREAQSSSRTTRSSYSSAIVRLVTSAFDQIISVSAVQTFPISNPTSNGITNCRSEVEVEREEEQVQIWNFSR